MSQKNLLMAAGGEIGRGRLWSFLLAIADSFTSGGTGGVYAQYAYGKGVAAQTNVGANNTLDIEVDGIVNGIPRASTVTPGAEGWLLTVGKVYQLRAFGYFDTFSDTTGGQLSVQWVDGNNNVLVGGSTDCPTTIFSPGTNTTARSTGAFVEFMYQVPASDIARVVKLRVTGATGTARKPGSSWGVSIVEIPVAA